MHFENPIGSVMKAWVNFLSQFVVVNMYLALKEDSLHHDLLFKEYDFIVSKFTKVPINIKLKVDSVAHCPIHILFVNNSFIQ